MSPDLLFAESHKYRDVIMVLRCPSGYYAVLGNDRKIISFVPGTTTLNELPLPKLNYDVEFEL